MSKKDPHTKADLAYPLHLTIASPDQYWAYPFVIAGYDGTVRLSLTQQDAIKVLHTLMKAYPLEVLAAL